MSPELERAIDMRDVAKKELLEAKSNFDKYMKRHESDVAIGVERIKKLEDEFASWERLVEFMRNAGR